MYHPLPPNAYIQNGRIFIPGLVGNIPAGNLKIRVRASGARPTGYSLSSNSSFTENEEVSTSITPPAPTFVSYSDTSNTFTFQAPAGYSYLDCDFVLNGIGPTACNSSTINVGSGATALSAIEVFVRAALPQRNEGARLRNHIIFTQDPAGVTTPEIPTGSKDDVANTLTIYHPLGISELLVSTNSSAYAEMSSLVINVGDVNLPVGYYKVKTKAAPGRNESPVYNSPQFFAALVATEPPVVTVDDLANTLSFYSPFGNSELLVSENNGAFNPYTGTINVGNSNVASGYYKAKVRAGNGRAESALSLSPSFTRAETIRAEAPTFLADDTSNTLSFDSPLGTSEILVAIGNAGFTAYAGPYSIGNQTLPIGHYRAKVRAATGRSESVAISSPAFTATVAVSAPGTPTNVVATATSSPLSVSVNATAPASNGSPITGYTIYRSDSPTALATNTALPYVDNTVASGTTYTYRVAAVNSVDTGPMGMSNAVTPTAPVQVVVSPSYFGSTLTSTPNEAEVKALTSNQWTPAPRRITIICEGTFPTFAEPASHGVRTSILDKNNFNITADMVRTTQGYTIDGASVSYNVYTHVNEQFDESFIISL